MRTIRVIRREVEGIRRTKAQRPPTGVEVYDEDVRLVDGAGVTVGLQLLAGRDLVGPLATALRKAEWADATPSQTSQQRLSGIITASLTFGCLPPVPLRRRYGGARSAIYRTNPHLAGLIDAATERIWGCFLRAAPEAATSTRLLVTEKGISPAWMMPPSPWTSGVANNNAAHPYHRDAGNVKGAWSGMLGLKRSCEGGFLHLAEYNTWLAIPSGSITLFDGGQTTHAVTPFKLTHPGGYRFTLVWYARSGMAACADDPADEPARAARQATKYAEKKVRS